MERVVWDVYSTWWVCFLYEQKGVLFITGAEKVKDERTSEFPISNSR